MNKLVYAIVLNYNSAKDCEVCVRYLSKQNYPFLKIIIVDNNSLLIDEKKELENIKDNYDVELLFNVENNGYSAGNNVGIKYAIENNAEWCLIVNPDVMIDEPNYIKNMMSTIQKYPQTVVAASKMILPNKERQNPYRESTYNEEFWWMLDSIRQRIGKSKKYLLPDITGYCPKVAGCCFFIKSSFLKDIGSLDENVFMYCEEPILAKQVKKHGYKELYVSEIYAYHNHIANEKGKKSERILRTLDSRIYYLQEFSEYGRLALKLLITSKKCQKLFWKIKRKIYEKN